jgi:hypothetical protein
MMTMRVLGVSAAVNWARVAHPIGGWDDDFVTGADGGEDGEVAGHLAARGNDDVGIGDTGETATGVVLGNRLTKGGDARRGGILRLAVGQGLGAGVLDKLRGIKVRLTDPEADDILTGGLEGLCLGVDGEGRRRGNIAGPRGESGIRHDWNPAKRKTSAPLGKSLGNPTLSRHRKA